MLHATVPARFLLTQRLRRSISSGTDSNDTRGNVVHVITRRKAAHAVEVGKPRALGGIVVLYSSGEGDSPHRHEAATRAQIARKLAHINGYEFGGEYDAACRYAAPLYFVPRATLLRDQAAMELRIRSEHDFFGGVVPHPFVATKTISHAVIDGDAARPQGWSTEFQRRVHDAVLPGYTTFTPHDALRAGMRLLASGPVRVKRACETGGRGQTVVASSAELEAAVSALDTAEVMQFGLVLERDLAEVTTYSVGRVRVGHLTVSYHGTQHTTPDNSGAGVYGGTDLIAVRGDFDALLARELEPEVRIAIQQACAYDAAAKSCFSGLMASRCNYDVARGRDRSGRSYSGVLEQSWRIGGASGAEVGALEAFRADPGLRTVRACCTEVYGDSAEPPPHATVYFRGVDEQVGRITKFSVIEPHADT